MSILSQLAKANFALRYEMARFRSSLVPEPVAEYQCGGESGVQRAKSARFSAFHGRAEIANAKNRLVPRNYWLAPC